MICSQEKEGQGDEGSEEETQRLWEELENVQNACNQAERDRDRAEVQRERAEQKLAQERQTHDSLAKSFQELKASLQPTLHHSDCGPDVRVLELDLGGQEGGCNFVQRTAPRMKAPAVPLRRSKLRSDVGGVRNSADSLGSSKAASDMFGVTARTTTSSNTASEALNVLESE